MPFRLNPVIRSLSSVTYLERMCEILKHQDLSDLVAIRDNKRFITDKVSSRQS